MDGRKNRRNLWGSLPWLIALLLGCSSCVSATWINDTPPLAVADYDGCQSINNLGGEMGVAYNPPDSLVESYVEEAGRGCVARLQFDIEDWAAYWLRLEDADLRPYRTLRFDVRADPEPGFTGQMKVELKRKEGAEIVILYVADLGPEWKTVRVDLDDFRPTGTNPPLATRQGVEELVFVFEAAKSGEKGVVYVDNIALEW
jgi:hypothetical protein